MKKKSPETNIAQNFDHTKSSKYISNFELSVICFTDIRVVIDIFQTILCLSKFIVQDLFEYHVEWL